MLKGGRKRIKMSSKLTEKNNKYQNVSKQQRGLIIEKINETKLVFEKINKIKNKNIYLDLSGKTKEPYCIGTWNFRSMNQGKLEVVKQEMTRVNIDILELVK